VAATRPGIADLAAPKGKSLRPSCGGRFSARRFVFGGTEMKLSIAALLLASAFVALPVVTPALADGDDAAWIKKCVNDNKREGATPEVVAAYCSCMNGKMSSSETLSVTAWEKTHPTEMAACDKESGWK
jgi:hypothetical protein